MMTHQSDGVIVMQSEKTVEPLFQLLVHKVTIENFDLMRDLARRKALPDCPEDSDDFFEQGTVLFLGPFGQSAGLDLQLWLCPNGDREDWDALTITISNEGTEDLPDFTKLALLDSKDGMKEISSCETVGICRAKRGYVRFFFNWTEHNILRVGSRLILKMEMRFLRRMVQLGSEPTKPPVSSTFHQDVFEYLSDHFFKSTNDRVIIDVAGTKMVCSKVLLSCRSPVFQRMFLGNFREATSESIELSDLDVETAILLLNWIQTDRFPGSSEISWTASVKLLMAADRFQIQRLIDFCNRQLRQLLARGLASLHDVVSMRKLIHENATPITSQLGTKGVMHCTSVLTNACNLSTARDCEGYLASKAALDPSRLWSVLDYVPQCAKVE
ncbi:putative BTB/POZ domain-containing protein [Neospora caninum Liverpool]|uniref:BTB/POZ domain-containing protein, putative n=1 Tax=Neospora caninum (strain Liverpool) TaxID=572307 RepID=F0VG58_NEOCL|nr:putative BTB/POZ domain-containing protein [Neospora caninum Liverpool]CBZ52702.1 putative BTB/POZ domain-containing protein [Neospora caninum Liverpool]CEL66680.1 TPA: BTB/POZ domain-containing protein, putative [Neospora caninum Liverpool]|eukprot:XP_003882734.1 putative BTB/POZ domain-containing protein [Neospora caninum Liverpool]